MGDISTHFNRSEFACKCGCGLDTVDTELVDVLEDIRRQFGASITINSGNRCEVYNRFIGGALKSQHPLSRAADIVVDGVDPKDVQDYIDEAWPDSLGMGRYNTFTHIDSRSTKARWG